jgi:hypothetical protein
MFTSDATVMELCVQRDSKKMGKFSWSCPTGGIGFPRD